MPAAELSYGDAEDLRQIAMRWKQKFPELLANVDVERISFVRCFGSKTKKTYATTIKLNELQKFLNGNWDYVITFYDHMIEDMGPGNLSVLVGHELVHVGGFDGNKFTLIDHDVKDHDIILRTFGLDWATDETLEDPTIAENTVKVKKKPNSKIEEDNIRFDVEEMN